MPTLQVRRGRLFELLHYTCSDTDFAALCFRYGIELDEVTTEKELQEKHQDNLQALSASASISTSAGTAASSASSSSSSSAAAAGADVVFYKIEIPANRYDLLCVEGLARALRVFLELLPVAPVYKVVPPAQGAAARARIVVKAASSPIRPFVVGAILRNITFTPASFASFIDLQDKLHQNIGRKRTLIAIGTHDLDTIRAPFSYEALPRKDIAFKALSEDRAMNADELFHYYAHEKPNCHLKPYLGITEASPVHPVIYDAQRIVCSLPPIINGEHSKITLQTKNVFVECTGTDATKLSVVLNQVCTMFSEYCATPYEIEQVEVVNESTGATTLWPQLDNIPMTVDVAYVNSAIGIQLSSQQMIDYLRKMSMTATLSPDGTQLLVQVPPTRSDVLHQCDLMEDIAISYGYDNIPRTIPSVYTEGRLLPLNMLVDGIREQVAQCGFTEVLTWVLLSFDDNYRFMQPKDVKGTVMDLKSLASNANHVSSLLEQSKPLIIHPSLALPKPVLLSDPKQLDFQLVRTTLIPGLLKALSNNAGQVELPIRIFEVGDVAFQDDKSDVGAKNQRRLGALYCNTVSGQEVILALISRVMAVNSVYSVASVKEYRAARAAKAEAKAKKAKADAAEAAKKAKQAAKSKAPAAAAASASTTAAPVPAAAAAAEEDEHDEPEWVVTNMFSLRASAHPSYFPGRCCQIILHRHAQADEIQVGWCGILHPDVLAQFGIPFVCSAMELELEHFL